MKTWPRCPDQGLMPRNPNDTWNSWKETSVSAEKHRGIPRWFLILGVFWNFSSASFPASRSGLRGSPRFAGRIYATTGSVSYPKRSLAGGQLVAHPSEWSGALYRASKRQHTAAWCESSKRNSGQATTSPSCFHFFGEKVDMVPATKKLDIDMLTLSHIARPASCWQGVSVDSNNTGGAGI